MPIYEFACGECGAKFEMLRLSSSGFADVECPSCKSKNVAKEMSTFAPSIGGFASAPHCESGSCGMPSSGCGNGMCGLN
jgi:putative FmdB family regulatory protein